MHTKTTLTILSYSFVMLFCSFSSTFAQNVETHEDAYKKTRAADQRKTSYDHVIHELEEASYQNRKAKADAGDIDEQVTLANMLQKAGRTEEAKYYYKLAADKGNKEAQDALLIYQIISDTKKEVRTTFSAVRIAAELGVSALVLAAFVYYFCCKTKIKIKTKDV